ncbi:MAG: dipeptidase [Kangiellaceae bacterium]|nr:dipeptidase [Kangiellaceae bacterium]
MIKKIVLGFIALVFLLILIAILVAPLIAAKVERNFNIITQNPPYEVSQQAQQLHNQLMVADLHADSLLWNRNLSKQAEYGHQDLPRMDKANLSLQVFGIVSKTPNNQNFASNDSDSDRLIGLSMVQLWPRDTWFSPLKRVIYQAHKFKQYAAEPANNLGLISNKLELAAWQDVNSKTTTNLKAGLLAIEGAHALEGDLSNYLKIKQAGIRMIGLAHFFDNSFAGSAHGIKKHGLTEEGRKLVLIAQQDGIIIDLAHSSSQTIDDVLAISTRPLVVSHTGVKATCDSPRNLSNKHIKAIAQTDGLIGIGAFKGATCGNSLDSILDAIDHVTNLVGTEHVALGLDLDGAVTVPFDVQGLPLLTQGLLQRGYSAQDVAKIMGQNIIRVMSQALN